MFYLSWIFDLFSTEYVWWLVLIVALVASALIGVFVEPVRRKFFQRREYDVSEENPWDEIMNGKSGDDQKKRK